jgi:hypothetical protein
MPQLLKVLLLEGVLAKLDIEVNQLWLQEKVNNGDIEVMKVKGEGNLADALTKALDGTATTKHIELTKQELIAGRHQLTPDFETAQKSDKEKTIESSEIPDTWRHDLSQTFYGSTVLELLSLDRVDTPCDKVDLPKVTMPQPPPRALIADGAVAQPRALIADDAVAHEERARRYQL